MGNNKLPLNRLLTLAVLPLAIFTAGLGRWWDGPQTRYGRYTTTDVQTLSAPICRALAPADTMLEIDAAFTGTSEESRQPARRWLVRAVDRLGGEEAHITWDAQTGRLLSIVNANFDWRPGEAVVGSTRRAAWTAHGWLRSFTSTAATPGGAAAHWRLAQAPKRISSQWHVRFRAGNHIAVVRIHDASGDLVSIEFKPAEVK